jgi:hypothetical protein
MKKSNRYSSFWNSNTPLTSKRGQLVLSNPAAAELLIDAVRKSRSAGSTSTRSKIIKVDFSETTAKDIADL